MDKSRIDAAARILLDCWQDGSVIESLPEELRPVDRAAGYAIQERYCALTGEKLFGWKIAATSAAGQQHIGVDGPLAGRLTADRVRADGATVALGPNRMLVAEPEFAFRMSRDLEPRPDPYLPAEVMEATADLYPAIEIPDSRFHPFETAGAPQLIADNACARLFVLGPRMPESWRTTRLESHGVRISGKDGAHEGTGGNVLGSPAIALAWIANETARFGRGLQAGDVVTTGTCATPLPLGPDDIVTADFGPLGRVSVRIAADVRR